MNNQIHRFDLAAYEMKRVTCLDAILHDYEIFTKRGSSKEAFKTSKKLTDCVMLPDEAKKIYIELIKSYAVEKVPQKFQRSFLLTKIRELAVQIVKSGDKIDIKHFYSVYEKANEMYPVIDNIDPIEKMYAIRLIGLEFLIQLLSTYNKETMAVEYPL